MTLRPDIDINGINEALITKADTDFGNIPNNVKYIVESWQSGTSWYRIWNDGWIEQGGVMTGSATSKTITLNTPFTTTNYTVMTTEREIGSTDTDGVDFTCMVRSVTTTSFSCSTVSGASRNSFWYACGY